jgi:signal transduction histidine kinase
MAESSAANDATQRRRQYVVDKDFQFSLLSTWLIMTLAFIAIVLLVLFWAFNTLSYQGLIPEQNVDAVKQILVWNVVVVVLLLSFFGAYMLVVSNRIAGPAYRIKQSLRQMRDGDFQFDVILRENDYLLDVAEEMNATIAFLRQREDRLIDAAAAAEALVEALADADDRSRAIAQDIHNALRDFLPSDGSTEG